MIFASLQIERDIPDLGQFGPYVGSWIEDAGVIAMLGIAIWGLAYALTPRREKTPLTLVGMLFLFAVCLTVICYAIFFLLLATEWVILRDVVRDWQVVKVIEFTPSQHTFLTLAGVFAITAAVLPVLAGLLGRITWRRVYALSWLSVKEAVRGRVIYGFCLMGLIFLFYGFFVSYKPEDQIRNYVTVVHTAMTPLFLVAAAFLGAFSIPLDVTRQTIHTIVTKPVVRFEIVLGRFLGYGALLTVILAVLSLLSLVYVIRGINPEAKRESYKARVPVFADLLRFHGTEKADEGINVGREWTLRSYIRGRRPGSSEPQQYAIWHFHDVPTYLAEQTEPIPFEFSFDIYRTTKGTEDLGVICTLYFVDGRIEAGDLKRELDAMHQEFGERQREIEKKYQARLKTADKHEREIVQREMLREAEQAKRPLIEKYGIFEAGGKEAVDYHTQTVEVPPELFRRLAQVRERLGNDPSRPPILKVIVKVNEDPSSRVQLLGVARRDLYLLAAELPFEQNFLKGMFGLWCNTMLVLGIAVTCSTYFSGVISLLCTLFFLGGGALVEHIRSLALGTNVGGGPLESAQRLFQGLPPTAPLEQTTATAVATSGDMLYRWFLLFVSRYIPDIHRFNLTIYVSEGFDIPWGGVLLVDNLLPTLGFLIPLGVLAYYLMNSREVANPT